MTHYPGENGGMDENPYRAPTTPEHSRLWYNFWWWIMVGGALLICLSIVAQRALMEIAARPPSRLIIIADGLAALGALSGLTVLGLAIIGRIFTRPR
jgi:hypothetical protein